MRLICPNCSAQYEIDASLIPDEGRDVQCSNCGHNWFELPPAPEGLSPPPDMPVEEPVEADASVADDEPEDAEGAPTETEAADRDVSPEAPHDADDEDDDWPTTKKISLNVPRQETPPQRPKRPGEIAALEILREEAVRELAKRRVEEPEAIETQQDLDLIVKKDRETPSRALRARMARLRGEEDEPDETPEEGEYKAPRRDLLPDIDEINSSLKPASAGGRKFSEREMAEQRKGFRAGFLGILCIAVLMILAYAWAPTIARFFPSTESALLAFVDWANGARDTLDTIVGRAS